MADGTIMVTLPMERYEYLLETEAAYGILTDVMLSSATLNWNKTGLNFDDAQTSVLLEAIAPQAVKKRMAELKAEAEKKAAAEASK